MKIKHRAFNAPESTRPAPEKGGVNMISPLDLDPREEFHRRVSPIEELEKVQIGKEAHQTTNMGTSLQPEEREKILATLKYPSWLANVVMVKKANGKWRMCVDFTDLNKACPKDPYHLPNIDRLIDGASGYKILSFMDAYSGYNQIKMNLADAPHTTFMTNTCNYFYNVMPFGLKNAVATYQRLMDRVFSE
ncbi:hypothetical protein QL285_009117 [Trifolium repens]|nr:hypothetical protein QL285_009117 [Trifolium repens]